MSLIHNLKATITLCLFCCVCWLVAIPAGKSFYIKNTDDIAAASCNPPFALKALSVTTHTATLDWVISNAPAEQEWALEVYAVGDTATGIPTHTQITSKPFILSNLEAGTQYFFKVKSICGPNNESPWSNAAGNFITEIINGNGCRLHLPIPDAGCPVPTEFPIRVSGVAGTQMGPDVILRELRLSVEHEWLVDLEMYLKSPTGRIVQLLDESGGTNDDFGDPGDTSCSRFMTLLNANACGEKPINEAGPPYTGRYLPMGNFNEFNDGSTPNGLWYLLVCDDALVNEGFLQYVELVFELNDCAPPSQLIARKVDSTFVELDWASGGHCDSTILEYGYPGFTPGTGTKVHADCPPYILTGLMGGTAYEIYIYENCGSGMLSNFACAPVQIHTQCAPPPITIFENFDDKAICGGFSCRDKCTITGGPWFNATDDEMDWLVNNRGTFTPDTGPSDDVSVGGNYIFMEASSFSFAPCAAGSEAVLYSNCIAIDTKSTDSCHLSFNYHMYGRSVNSLRLEISNDGQSWQTIWSKTGDQGNTWRQAKISLTAWNGQTAQFRLVATRGNGSRGDIALDNIRFNGSLDLGEPAYIFYVDADGDGFGNPDRYLKTCFPNIPAGYVENADDCDDDNSDINLVSDEIPCNGLDENCNGLFDDLFLPPPGASDIIICEGDTAILEAQPNYGGDIIWYDSLGNLLQIGNPLILPELPASGTLPKTYRFFADELAGFCFSTQQAVATVTVQPNPDISTPDMPRVCAGTIIDLQNDIVIADKNNTNGNITFHTGMPATANNQLANPIIRPDSDTDIFIKSVANGGCMDTTILKIKMLSVPMVQISPDLDTLPLCIGQSAFLTGSVSNSTGTIRTQWNTFETAATIRVPSDAVPGALRTYIFQAIDTNSCMAADTLVVQTVSSVTRMRTTVSDVTFCNGNHGSILAEPLDGTPPYFYQWDGPVRGSAQSPGGSYLIDSLLQGSYSITVSDSSPGACTFVNPFTLVNGPSARVRVDSIHRVRCFGEDNGAIFLSISGNNPTILWSNGKQTEDVTGLAAGTYSVTVTADGCQSILSDLEVVQPDSLFGLAQVSDVACFGGTSGAIELQVFGGVPDYNFSWSDNGDTQNRENLSSDIYTYTITDANGCEFTSDSIVVDAPTALSAVYSAASPGCFGAATGAVSLIPAGGMPPYRYHWSNGTALQNLENVAAGIYAVTISDANGCDKVIENIEVVAPPDIALSLVQKQDASCFGKNDGFIQVSATGGSGGFTYTWSTGQDSSFIGDLPKGKYQVTVHDENGCEAVSDTIDIDAPSSLEIRFNIQPPSCVGRMDGRINTEIRNGGLPPFNYTWSTRDTTAELAPVGVGFYSLSVADAQGCINTFDSLEVTATQVMTDSSLVAAAPACFDQSNGFIFSNILGGLPPYTYQWNTGADTKNLQNLNAGTYFLTVSDSRNCQLITDTIQLENPSEIELEAIAVEAIKCHDDNTGAISVTVSGGTAPYEFIWNNGLLYGSTISNLGAGTYELMVRDSSGCLLAPPAVSLSNPTAIDLQVDVLNLRNCDEDIQQDTIRTQIHGGKAPFSYTWNTGDTTSFLPGVIPGEYAITVEDAAGCTHIRKNIKITTGNNTFKIRDIQKQDVRCFGTNDGQITVWLEGGEAPYQFLWSDGAGENGGTTDSSELIATNLEGGLYTLTVVDKNGCVVRTDALEISEPGRLLINVQSGTRRDVSCFGGSDGRINLFARGGSYPYHFEWRDERDNFVSDRQNPVGLPAGLYKVIVEDELACRDSITKLKINQPDSFYIKLNDKLDVNCFADSSGHIAVKAIGGTAPYNYFWNNGTGNPTVVQLPAGDYRVTVEDANRCQIQEEYTLLQPSQPITLDTFTITEPLCHGTLTGSLDFEVSGGSPGYNYLLNGRPLTGTEAQNLPAANYTLLVFDQKGCTYEKTFKIGQPPALNLTFTTKPASNGNTGDGSATVHITGGIPPYEVLWTTGDTTLTISDLYAGNYFVIATDSAGCTIEGSAEVSLFSGASDMVFNNALRISPNPTSGLLLIDSDITPAALASLSIESSEGRHLQNQMVNIRKGMPVQLDISQLPGGIYFLKIQVENEWGIWRIIKQ